jgi:hypothetical protein
LTGLISIFICWFTVLHFWYEWLFESQIFLRENFVNTNGKFTRKHLPIGSFENSESIQFYRIIKSLSFKTNVLFIDLWRFWKKRQNQNNSFINSGSTLPDDVGHCWTNSDGEKQFFFFQTWKFQMTIIIKKTCSLLFFVQKCLVIIKTSSTRVP